MRSLALLAVVSVGLAGCIGSAPPAEELQPAAAPPGAMASAAHALRLDAEGCTEGGGYSTYNIAWLDGLLPEPWVLADVSEDLGNPLILGMGEPNAGDGIAGIYHATWTCDAWLMDGTPGEAILGGFVGVRVEPPPFDPGGAVQHYFVTVLSTGDHHVMEHLAEAGFHAAMATGMVHFDWAGTPLLHQVLDDEDHGRYEVQFVPREAGPKLDGVVRLWMLHEDGQGTYKPMALDFADVGGTHYYAEQGNGPFTHLETADHEPLPGAAGNVAGLAYRGFTRTVTVGPMPLVALNETWEHA